MRALLSLLSGLIFGIGLIVSGLANPAKVQAFLDITGVWDPSLAFTMGGAVLVTAFGYALVLRRERPWFDTRFFVPASQVVDRPLLVGAALFGVGWGLAGYCPGPALVALTLGNPGTLAFIAAMIAGMALARATNRPATAPGGPVRAGA